MGLILCVDAGLANIGAAVMDTCPTAREAQEHHGFDGGLVARPVELAYFSTEKCDSKIKLRKTDDRHKRVQECVRFYAGIIGRHGIKRAACELPQWGAPDSQSAVDLCYISIPIVATLEALGVASEWYSPREVKQAATGRPGATKKQVMAAIERVYPEVLEQFPASGRREHVCDALAVWMAARNGNLARL